jgi:hypothetical protein
MTGKMQELSKEEGNPFSTDNVQNTPQLTTSQACQEPWNSVPGCQQRQIQQQGSHLAEQPQGLRGLGETSLGQEGKWT